VNQSVPALDLSYVMDEVRASGLLTSLCTITVPPASTTFGDSGAMDPTTAWADLPGHVAIPCKDAPINTGDGVSVTELKSMEDIQAVNLRHVLLDNYYPLILASYRATVDGKVYDIVNAESDSHRQMTRLALELRTI
jgi:hypothetical protein